MSKSKTLYRPTTVLSVRDVSWFVLRTSHVMGHYETALGKSDHAGLPIVGNHVGTDIKEGR